jgi:hypothetical protein
VQKKSTQANSPQVRRINRHSLRSGFNGFLRALLGEPGFFATIAGAMRKHRRQLDISVGISGPHDFAVRAAPFVFRRGRVHRIPRPTFVTIAKRPSFGARDGGDNGGDLGLRSTLPRCDISTRRANHLARAKCCQELFCHSGDATKSQTMVRAFAPENLEVSGLVLRTILDDEMLDRGRARDDEDSVAVTPALVAGIHVFLVFRGTKDVDGRVKPGHDERGGIRRRAKPRSS